MYFVRPLLKLTCTDLGSGAVQIWNLKLRSVVICALAFVSAVCGSATAAGRHVDVSQPFWVEQVVSGLNFPASMVWLPNGDMLIPEREGGVRLVHKDVLDPTPLSGVPPSFQNALNGLKDIALDPDFASNHLVYLLLVEGSFEARRAAVYRLRYADHGFVEPQRIFLEKDTMSGSGVTAGRIIFLRDKTLLIATNDDHYHRQFAQRLDSFIGKIVRINRDGSIPADNPFLNNPKALPEIWTYGHRVTHGLYRAPDSDLVVQVEVGPEGGDELNFLKAGANFGWPKVSWGFDYSGLTVGPRQFGGGTEDPIMVWTPSESPSGITYLAGNKYPFWKDSYFVGLLTSKSIDRIKLEGRRVVLREKLLMDLEERIRDVRVGPDGLIYVLTDHNNGRLLRLVPGRPHGAQLAKVATKLEPPKITVMPEILPADLAAGQKAFERRCASCHNVGKDTTQANVGPNLRTIYGSRVGAQPGYNYSAAMNAFPQTWLEFSLNIFLSNPDGYVPGTRMTAGPITDAQERVNIIAYLQDLRNKADAESEAAAH
jgi:glucose/arabinose dehydrogenase/cytochrome c2